VLLAVLVASPFVAARQPTLRRPGCARRCRAGWTLLAGLGLVAIAIAALTLIASKREDPSDTSPLGFMRDDTEPAAPCSRFSRHRPPLRASIAIADATSSAVDLTRCGSQCSTSAGDSQLFLALSPSTCRSTFFAATCSANRLMPAVWLMLLDLCRTHGREDLSRNRAQVHHRFSVCTPA
jgi:hypothetical protein